MPEFSIQCMSSAHFLTVFQTRSNPVSLLEQGAENFGTVISGRRELETDGIAMRVLNPSAEHTFDTHIVLLDAACSQATNDLALRRRQQMQIPRRSIEASLHAAAILLLLDPQERLTFSLKFLLLTCR